MIPPWASRSADPPSSRAPRATEFVGRETERTLLRGAVQRAAAGDGGLVLVGGEAGIGKTTLIEHVLAESDLLVLAGEGSRHGCEPYRPIVTVLRACHRLVAGGLRESGPLWRQLGALLPELGTAHLPSDHEALAEAICDAVRAVVRRRPAAIFLDDLQWADHGTLHVLPSLAATIGDMPVVLIGAYRSDELARRHPLRELRAELRRRRRVVDVSLKPLEPTQTAELAERLLRCAPGPRLARTLHGVTQGVPFFIEELVAGLAGSASLEPDGDRLELRSGQRIQVTETVRDTVLMRFDGLSERAREALELVAVAGLCVERSLLGGPGIQDGLDDLVARGLLLETGEDEVAFRHILVRDAVYGSIPWAARREKHRHLAEGLEHSGAAASLIAAHWVAAKEPAKARPHLVAAAELSRALHAYRDAHAALAHALADWSEGDDEERRIAALEQLGDCAQLCGDLAGAAHTWERVAGARRSADDGMMGETERRLAGIYELGGDWDRALAARAAAASAFSSGRLVLRPAAAPRPSGSCPRGVSVAPARRPLCRSHLAGGSVRVRALPGV